MYQRPKDDLWEQVLKTNDRVEAKRISAAIDTLLTVKPVCWKAIGKVMGYPWVNMFRGQVMNSHTRRIMVDIKLLAHWGKHSRLVHK